MQHVREYWRRYAMALLLVVSVGVGVVGYSVYTAPTAHADAACGDEPDWWNPSWLSWQACEVTNGLAGSLSQVESINPLFQTISDTASAISSSVSDTFNRLGDVLNAVQAVPGQITDFFTPHDTDWQPVLDKLSYIRSQEPFYTVDSVMTLAQSVRDDWVSAESRFTPGASITPGSLGAALCGVSCTNPDTSASNYDFGPLGSGVEMWLWFMDRVGMSQDTVKGLFSIFIVMATAWSILSEFGVRFGSMIARSW